MYFFRGSVMFEYDDLNIEILNIFLINRDRCEFNTPKRPFHILTKRISGYSDMFFGNRRFSLDANSIFYIPSDTEYYRKSYGHEVIVAVHFNIINHKFKEPEEVAVDSDMTDSILLNMNRIWQSRKTGYRYECTSMLYKLLSEIIIPEKHTEAYIILEKSIEYIENNLRSKMTVRQLSCMCNISETYYRRLFKKEFGLSPVEYINNKRILKAKEMLVSGYFSVSETAYECGFSEPRYFNAVFKNSTGMSPTQFIRCLRDE